MAGASGGGGGGEDAAAVELRRGITELYDESSGMWEKVWGDHMHHGFYDPHHQTTTAADHISAQIRMIHEALRFAGINDDFFFVDVDDGNDDRKPPRERRLVDVGCGIGGSSRYLASKYEGLECHGITLSPVQAQRAQALAAVQGLPPHKASFQVGDALEQPFPDGHFDVVWSMESGEHMPDKTKFVSEMARVAKPGAHIVIVTWCHRDLEEGEDLLAPDEEGLLGRICRAYYLPTWCSASHYVDIARSLDLKDIRTADWSENVAPFWPAVMRVAFTWNGFTSLLRTGWKTIRGAMAMPLMMQGYKKKLIRFSIITCRKPTLVELQQQKQ